MFKDKALALYDGGTYAFLDRKTGKPWGVFRTYTDEKTGETRTEQVEFWVDPYNEEVRAYNAAIAEEVASLGVDEIQFDYIRFPSDGDTSTLTPPYKRRREHPPTP